MNAIVNWRALMQATEAVLAEQARDAVAELVEAAGALADAVTFRIDDPRAAMLDRVVAALKGFGDGRMNAHTTQDRE